MRAGDGAAVVELDGILEAGASSAEAGHEGHDHRRRLLASSSQLPQSGIFGFGFSAAAAVASFLSGGRRPQRLLLQASGMEEDGSDVTEEEDGHGAHDHPFPIAMVAIMFGYLLMVAAEHLTHALMEMKFRQRDGGHGVAVAEGAGAAAPVGGGGGAPAPQPPSQRACGGEAGDGHRTLTLTATPSQSPSRGAVAEAAEESPQSPFAKSLTAVDTGAEWPHPDDRSHDPSHSHLHPAGARGTALEAFRLAGMALLFELGCVFHSFIIGLMLGTTTDYDSVATLMIALSFHQVLEGIALATVLVSASLSLWHVLGAAALYCLTCPVGIAVGIGIADGYDSHSTTARAVQGTLNAVSAGLLLYLASALVACDFGAGSLARWRLWQRALLFGVMCTGAAVFAVLAIWA